MNISIYNFSAAALNFIFQLIINPFFVPATFLKSSNLLDCFSIFLKYPICSGSSLGLNPSESLLLIYPSVFVKNSFYLIGSIDLSSSSSGF